MNYTALKEIEVKIRKPRQCFGCLRKFEAGRIMRYNAGVLDGDFCSSYLCLACYEISKLTIDDYEDGFPEGFVKEVSLFHETPEEVVMRLKQQKKK